MIVMAIDKKDMECLSEAINATAVNSITFALSELADKFDFKKQGELEAARRAIRKEASAQIEKIKAEAESEINNINERIGAERKVINAKAVSVCKIIEENLDKEILNLDKIIKEIEAKKEFLKKTAATEIDKINNELSINRQLINDKAAAERKCIRKNLEEAIKIIDEAVVSEINKINGGDNKITTNIAQFVESSGFFSSK